MLGLADLDGQEDFRRGGGSRAKPQSDTEYSPLIGDNPIQPFLENTYLEFTVPRQASCHCGLSAEIKGSVVQKIPIEGVHLCPLQPRTGDQHKSDSKPRASIWRH